MLRVTYLFTALIMIVSLLVQSHTSFDALRIGGVKPDLLFIAIVYYGYTFGSFYGEVTGFIGGILQDSVSNVPIGLMTLPKVMIGFTIGMIGRSFMKNNILIASLVLFIASLAKGLITMLLCVIFHESHLSDVVTIILPESFYNAILAPLLWFLFDKIYEDDIPKEGRY